MSEKQQIYVVRDAESTNPRLVRAANKAQVRAHLIKPLTIEYAEQDDLFGLLSSGVKVEQADNGSIAVAE